MKVLAHLVQKHNDKTDQTEWAFVSEKSDKVLKWFGTQKPSKEEVEKEERRVQYFKHANSDIVDERFSDPKDRQAYNDALPFQGPWNGYGQKSPIEKVYPAISKVLGRRDPIKFPMLAKIEADIVDERFSDPHGGYRHDSSLPIDDTYGWGDGHGAGEFGTATENNPMGQGVRRAFADEESEESTKTKTKKKK